jgi:acetate kinase
MGSGIEAPVLVLNAGSSSIKASLLAGEGTCLWHEQRSWAAAPPEPEEAPGDDRAPGDGKGGLEGVLAGWLPGALAAWQSDISLVGHRVVHGGERFTAPTRLTPEVLAALEDLVPLAPLHNAPALRVMRWLSQWQPHLEQWACFDTAFHSTLPPEAHTYALPAAWRQAGLRRFGFHGLNHQHIGEVVGGRLRAGAGLSPAAPLRLISCHLGAGCSLCAIRDGRSIATTMGFTPMEGLVMATRSGSVDPGLLLHQLRRGMAPADLDQALNGESGLLGLSELSGSMKELREAAATGHTGAILAISVFRHSLLEGIGAMAACLGGVDVIALTGGIGEHDGALRRELEEALTWLRPFDLLTIPADEEGQIARSCRAAAQGALAL